MRKSIVFLLSAAALGAGGAYVVLVMLRTDPLPDGILYANGYIEATQVVVSAEVAGRVVENHLIEGAPVRAGAGLVRIDEADLRLQLDQAQRQAEAVGFERAVLAEEARTARHHLETAERDLERHRRLYDAGTVTPTQLRQVEDRVEDLGGRTRTVQVQAAQAQARLAAAERQVELLERQFQKTAVVAPIAGTVLARAIEAGEYASPGRSVAVLADLRRLELKVYIPERDVGRVKLGDAARVQISAFPDRYFPATVARVDQQAQFTPRDIHMPDERVRTVFGVVLALDNPEGYLKPGMTADAWVRWQSGLAWPETLPVPR
jgi:HlyD family secretion protein